MNKLSTHPCLHRPTLIGIVLASTVAAAAQTASGADLSVCPTGCPYAAIQSAIDNSRSGDVIHIAAGTYFENLLIEGKRLTLLGAGQDLTEINGRDRAATVTLGTVDVDFPKTVSIIGVTITHGRGPDGGGVIARGAVLDLQNSIVASNQSSGNGGGIAIATFGLFSSTITGCMIVHNRAAGAGGGINVGAEALVQITNSTIARNTAGTIGGGLSGEGASSTTIQTTTFSDNTAHESGGGIFLAGGLPKGAMTITGSSLVGNSAALTGGGVVAEGHLAISSTVVARNTAGGDGGGLWGGLSLNDVFVIQNRAGGQGGGVFNGSLVKLTNSTIADNVPNNCVDAGGTGCP
jgi:predicted outer membrane repeat protein